MVNTLDVERVSTPTVPDKYAAIKSPKLEIELENGAIREGEPPKICSRESLGLLAQYAGVGLVGGVLPGVIYPVLQNYLNAEGTIVVSATVLVQLPWSYKMFFGIISDCFPIFGCRRRPYMIIGWIFCCVMLFLMAGLHVPAAYYGDLSLRNVSPSAWTDAQKAMINEDAPNDAGKYVVPMMLASFGYLMSEVAADALVVEYAQREPLATRGRLQTAVYAVKTAFNAIAAISVAFAFNGEEYGGEFDFSLSFPQMMLILACCCVPLIPVTWIFMDEPKPLPIPFKIYIRAFWDLLQQRAIYQIVAYKFFSGVFNSFNIVSSSNIKSYWVHVTPFNNSIMAIVGQIFYATTLALTGKYGLDWNWRYIIIITMVSALTVDAFMTMLTVWDVVRNQWFWLGVPVLEYLPDGIRFMVATYCVVELAEQGYEGALYGLLTATTNLSTPFGRSMAKIINAQFKVWLQDIIDDTQEVRRDVTITIWICYAMKLLSLCFLPLLPRQKEDTRELRRTGGKSKIMGIVTIVYLTFAMIWSTMINLMTMYDKTKCWKITGGCAPKRG
ncbi:Folate-biopterin transporter, partial [Globisporangium splendens]